MPCNAAGFSLLIIPLQAFTQPGQFGSQMKAQALQRSSYMSEMDKFYAGLGQQKEQFEATHELAERKQTSQESQFGETLGFEKEKFGQEFGLAEELGRGELDVARGTLGMQEERTISQERLGAERIAQDVNISTMRTDVAREGVTSRERLGAEKIAQDVSVATKEIESKEMLGFADIAARERMHEDPSGSDYLELFSAIASGAYDAYINRGQGTSGF